MPSSFTRRDKRDARSRSGRVYRPRGRRAAGVRAAGLLTLGAHGGGVRGVRRVAGLMPDGDRRQWHHDAQA
ncbi:hypothetical protein GCM10010104_28790 [Streptomyces indiaensis]|uniref:Uncharacterized protein n=1 Tax=Streptomyces indiaensis TaxID=284033 RepID=A0ABP5QDS1_9ACTN